MPSKTRSTRPASGPTPADEGIEAARADDRRRAEIARSFDDWHKVMMSQGAETAETRYVGALNILSDADVVALLQHSPESLYAALRCSAAGRGMNETGRWVGFPAAKLVHRAAIEERGAK